MDKMDHNAHSVYLMYYHLIMVVKYRRNVIDDPISERAKEIWERIAPDYGITLEEWNHDVDHAVSYTHLIQRIIKILVCLASRQDSPFSY